MSISFIEKYPQNKKSTVAIRPYFDPKKDNMGLQNYGQVLFDGTFHVEPMACVERNGIKRYVNGLNEFAPELFDLSEDEREAKIKQIRITVADLERRIASNIIDPSDKEFWNKVTVMRPDNDEYFGKVTLKCQNDPVFLEPDKDPLDLIKLLAIEAGGFSSVAKSLEDARSRNVSPKFYLDKLEETASTNTEVKKLRNKAAAELQKLFDKNTNKLFYVAKVLDPDSSQYTKSTPTDVIYDNMDRFISGELVDKDKRRTASKFLEIASLDMETLKLRSVVKDASAYKFLAVKSDGFIYYMETGVMMGRTTADAVEFLKNPLNEDTLVPLIKRVEKYWNQ